jgi:hypothetical protein
LEASDAHRLSAYVAREVARDPALLEQACVAYATADGVTIERRVLSATDGLEPFLREVGARRAALLISTEEWAVLAATDLRSSATTAAPIGHAPLRAGIWRRLDRTQPELEVARRLAAEAMGLLRRTLGDPRAEDDPGWIRVPARADTLDDREGTRASLAALFRLADDLERRLIEDDAGVTHMASRRDGERTVVIEADRWGLLVLAREALALAAADERREATFDGGSYLDEWEDFITLRRVDSPPRWLDSPR